ncbi:unnamed protein product [Adineta ricciae]|uniref:Purinergic receptor n=1 Tax=Adineta ricciae TaxID=249248 RepID=A0A814NPY9_ADIRI|nr:unnamed protein product [Adineta ricciae]CAF1276901.1 unnamed protein product [Adineta ricciae]
MGGSVKDSCSSLFSSVLFSYSTVKLVKVPNTPIGILNRILQLVILLYIIGYIVVWKRGYQQFQEPHGTSVIKVKGIARVTGSGNSTYFTSDDTKYIWDTAEYEIPPIENNAFFVATHQTITRNQTQGKCPTALDDKLFCTAKNKTICAAGKPTRNTFGFYTGDCVPSREDDNITVCEMEGWCPEELSDSLDYVINEQDLRSFTIFLKTMISFSLFKKKLRNIQTDVDFQCRFDGTAATAGCPIFPMGYILDQLDTNKTALLLEGGLIEILQDWSCNFDLHPKSCTPKYEFSLLQSGDDAQSPGINYRSAQKYYEGGRDRRTLSKVYGLRFVVTISGKGGQFNIVNLFVAIGSGIGFMVIAGIVCDAIFMYVHRSRRKYREGKISICEVEGYDALA